MTRTRPQRTPQRAQPRVTITNYGTIHVHVGAEQRAASRRRTAIVRGNKIGLPRAALRTLLGGGTISATAPVGVEAPSWARTAFRVVGEGEGEWWWASSGDMERALDVEDPFVCPWGTVGDLVQAGPVTARLKQVRVQRTGGRWVWNMQLEAA